MPPLQILKSGIDVSRAQCTGSIDDIGCVNELISASCFPQPPLDLTTQVHFTLWCIAEIVTISSAACGHQQTSQLSVLKMGTFILKALFKSTPKSLKPNKPRKRSKTCITIPYTLFQKQSLVLFLRPLHTKCVLLCHSIGWEKKNALGWWSRAKRLITPKGVINQSQELL